jgi:hypothetical protein
LFFEVPLILIGDFLSFTIAEEVVHSGLADYVALSRPLLRESQLIARWVSGDIRKASCIFCNKCFSTLFMEEVLPCPVEKEKTASKSLTLDGGGKIQPQFQKSPGDIMCRARKSEKISCLPPFIWVMMF